MRTTAKKSRKVRNVVFLAITVVIAVMPAILTSKFGFGISPILTSSMEPMAHPGDVFVTRLVPSKTLKLGDIIAVNNQVTGTYYSHRIQELRVEGGAFRIITKGDANSEVDLDPFLISVKGQVSKVIGTVPYLGRPMVYMNTMEGRRSAANFLVVANVLALIAFLFRKKIIENLNPERVYKELYVEERHTNQQYRDLIDSLRESLAIEKENTSNKEKAGHNV